MVAGFELGRYLWPLDGSSNDAAWRPGTRRRSQKNLPCGEAFYAAQGKHSEQPLPFQLVLQVSVIHRGDDDAADAEDTLADDHHQEQFPGGRFDFRADDFGIEEVFQLVDDDEEEERGQRHIERDAEAQDDNDGVGDEVAHHRYQADDEGDRQHGEAEG